MIRMKYRTGVFSAFVTVAATVMFAAGISMPANAAPVAYDAKLSDHTTTTDASAGLRAAALAVQAKSGWGGGTILVNGKYTVNTTVDLGEVSGAQTPQNEHRVWNKIRLVGTGVGASKLSRNTLGPMFRLGHTQICRPAGNNPCFYKGAYLEDLAFLDMGFETTSTSYIWELKTGAITNSTWQRLRFDIKGVGGGILYAGPGVSGEGGLGGQNHNSSWRDITAYVSPQSRHVPMRYVSANNYCNGNVFESWWAHHRKNVSAPFFEMKPTTGQFTNTTFRAITGEQNGRGLIAVYGINGLQLEAIQEWDMTMPGYYSSIIGVNPNGATPSKSVNLVASGDVVTSRCGRNGARNFWIAPNTVGVNTNGSVSRVLQDVSAGGCAS